MPNKYFLSAIAAFVIWGFFSLALKPLHDYPSGDILIYRVFYAALLLVLVNGLFRRQAIRADINVVRSLPKSQRWQTLGLTAAGGLLLITNWFLFIYAINHVSLKSGSFAYLICPILTTILAALILNEKLEKFQWLAVGISAVSCVLLVFESPGDLAFSLLIALTFALYLISQRRNNRFDRFSVLTVQMLIACAVILPFLPMLHVGSHTQPVFVICLNFIVIVFTIVPLFLNLYALKGMNSATVGILMYLNPMIHFLLALFYFNEAVDALEAVAYGLILLSILVFNARTLGLLRR